MNERCDLTVFFPGHACSLRVAPILGVEHESPSFHRLAPIDLETTMDLEHLRLLYRYNRWANARILDHADKLTSDQFHAPIPGGSWSVRDTLVHMMETEFFWSGLIWPGKAIDIDWEPYEFHFADYPNVAAILTRWAEIESDLFAFNDGLTPEGERSHRAHHRLDQRRRTETAATVVVDAGRLHPRHAASERGRHGAVAVRAVPWRVRSLALRPRERAGDGRLIFV